MKRIRITLVLVVFVIALALSATTAQAMGHNIGAWSQIYNGVQYATGTDDDPIQKAFALKIDLQNPAVHLYASHDNGTLPYEVALQTTPAFLSDHGLKAAINTCYFDAGLSPNTNLEGVEISNGTLVSSWQAGRQSELLVTSANVASIVYAGGNPTGMYTACSGDALFLSNGTPAGDDVTRQPRSGCGLTQDGRYLILAVVDGRQDGWSVGTTIYEMGQWMADFGAYNAFNLDGGGSSTLVRQDVGTVNRPCYGYARSVGASLGVSVTETEVIVDNPAGTWSANWILGTMSPDKYGADYRYRSTAAVSDPFTWRPNLPTAGNWEVYAWWSVGGNRSTTAPYIVYYNGGNLSVPKNQQINGGMWNSLGTYNFLAGTSGNVKLSCWTTAGFVVIADAVKFVKR